MSSLIIPIPFLKFPEKVQSVLLGQLTPIEIFELSLSSPEAQKVVKETLKSEKFTIEVHWDTEKKSISVVENFQFSSKRFNWVFENASQNSETNGTITRSINPAIINFSEKSEQNFKCSKSKIDEILLFFEYIIGLFYKSKKELRILDLDDGNLRKFQKFPCFWKCESLVVAEGRVSEDVMNGFLDFYQASYKSIGCNAGEGFVPEKPISGALFDSNGSWIDRNVLLNFDCKAVTISTSNLSSEDFNLFLKKWMAGNDNKLQYLNVRGSIRNWTEGFKELDMDLITKDLTTIPGVPKRQEAMRYECYGFRVPYHLGKDLRRADGVLGTVVVYQNRWKTCSFLFEVWKDSNPNLES